MRDVRWLPWVAACAGMMIAGESLVAGQLDEKKVRAAVLLRFDENRNDKLDVGEAKQARSRLRNLLEEKSSREINILTWREDVHDLLKLFDQDGDNRLTVEERDEAVRLLDRIIPKVDSSSESERSSSLGSSKEKKDKSGSSNTADRDRRSSRGGSNSGGYGGSMGGGGFGNSMRYGGTSGSGYGSGSSGGNYGSGNFSGSGVSNSSSNSLGSQPNATGSSGSATGGVVFNGSANQSSAGNSASQANPPRPSAGPEPLGDTPANRPLPPSAVSGTATSPGSARPNGSGGTSPSGTSGGTAPDPLAKPGGGLTPPADSKPTGPKPAGGPVSTPPIPKPNF